MLEQANTQVVSDNKYISTGSSTRGELGEGGEVRWKLGPFVELEIFFSESTAYFNNRVSGVIRYDSTSEKVSVVQAAQTLYELTDMSVR